MVQVTPLPLFDIIYTPTFTLYFARGAVDWAS